MMKKNPLDRIDTASAITHDFFIEAAKAEERMNHQAQK